MGCVTATDAADAVCWVMEAGGWGGMELRQTCELEAELLASVVLTLRCGDAFLADSGGWNTPPAGGGPCVRSEPLRPSRHVPDAVNW